MANRTYLQTNFTAGRVSELLFGRTDISKFYNGVSELQNFIVKQHGPVVRRSGTRYVATVGNSDNTDKVRLVPFQFSTDQTYMLEFGNGYVRFYRDRERIMDDGSLESAGTSSTAFELDSPYWEPATASVTGNVEHVPDSGAQAADALPGGFTYDPRGVATIVRTSNWAGQAQVGLRVRIFGFTDVTEQGLNRVSTVRVNTDNATIGIVLKEDPNETTVPGGVRFPGVAELTVGSNHGIQRGALVEVSGCNISAYNKRARVFATTSTTIRYELDEVPSPITANAVTTGSVTMLDRGVDKINFKQSADVLFIANENEVPMELQRLQGFKVLVAVWSSNFATLTIASDTRPHGFQASDATMRIHSKIIVSGMTPDYWNGCYEVYSAKNDTVTFSLQFSAVTISTSSWDSGGGGIATHNTAAAHGLFVGDSVVVASVTPSGYNGTFTVVATPTTTQFTVALVGDPGGGGTGGTSTQDGPTTPGVFGSVEGWQIVPHENFEGPYEDANLDQNRSVDINVAAPALDDIFAVTPTSGSKNIFFESDIGRLFAHKPDPFDPDTQQIGHGKIVYYYDPGSVNVLSPDDPFKSPFITATAGAEWRLGAWSDSTGWPWTVAFMQGRLGWGGSVKFPSTLWISAPNDINRHKPEDSKDESVTIDNGIVRTIDDDLVNAIYWMENTSHGMIVGTDGGEFLIGQTSTAEALSNNNIENNLQSRIGSKRYVHPVRAGNAAILFVQKAGRKLIETTFSFEDDGFRTSDLTVLSEDITRSGIIDIAYTEEPSPIIWCALDNGKIVSCTYERGQDVVAWQEHVIGGTLSGEDRPQIKSIAAIHDTSGAQPVDQLWMVVRRTIDGGAVDYVEFLEDEFETGDSLEDAFFVDSGFTYDSTSTSTVSSGIDHLEGATVKVFADGTARDDEVVTSGSITISGDAATKIQIGLSYESKLATLPVELREAQPESTQKVKRLERAHVRFLNSQGVEFGVDESALDSVEFDDTTTLHSVVIEDMHLGSPYERNQKMWLTQSGVFPTTIQSIAIETEVQPVQD